MVDGIPQSTPLRDGKRSGFTVDPAFVERVEVIYGANAIQGVGATGGVINYVTTTAPENGDWLNRVTLEGSTDDFEDHGFHYRSEEHTSELQSLMRISYAVFCLKQNTCNIQHLRTDHKHCNTKRH